MAKKMRRGIDNPIASRQGDNYLVPFHLDIGQKDTEWREKTDAKNKDYIHDKDGSNYQKNIREKDEIVYTPKTAFGRKEFEEELKNLPKSSFTTWYMDSLRLKALEENFTATTPNMYIHPMVALQVSTIVMQIYNPIRHGLAKNPELQRYVDEKIIRLNQYNKKLGQQIAITQDETQIDWEVYHKFVDEIMEAKSLVEECQANLGLRIPFTKKHGWKEILERTRGESTRHISQKDSENPLFKKEEPKPPDIPKEQLKEDDDINLDSEVNKDEDEGKKDDKEGDTATEEGEDREMDGDRPKSSLEETEEEDPEISSAPPDSSKPTFSFKYGYSTKTTSEGDDSESEEEKEEEVKEDE